MPGLLTQWDPYAELAELRSRADRTEDLSPDTGWKWMPAIDLERSDANLIMRADVPGFKPEEINIEVEDEMLTISGKYEEGKAGEGQALAASRWPLRVLLALDRAARGR
jgi:HSP20 family protein